MAKRNRSIEHPTLNDVARAAGVSRATAARALGGYGAVSQDARERVLETASRLRYRANVLARSMRSGTSHTIGLIVADIGLAYFAQAVRGIADAAKASGFEVILANSDEDLEKERAALGVLIDKRVDGLIVAPASVSEVDHLIEAANRGLPIVLLDRGTTRVGGDIVVVDNHAAAKTAVAYLAGLGHRQIAIVLEGQGALSASAAEHASPALSEAMTSTLRQIGWAAGLQEAGLPVTDDLIHRTRYDIAAARAATAAALRMAARPTAMLTADETMTIGALDAIREAGLRIPEQISIVAFDDPSWASVMRPPLTVIAQPVHGLGIAAANRLLARIAGDERPPEVVLLRTQFVVRGSTAPAQGS